MQEAKKLGYSDKQIASLLKSSETVIRARRKRLGVPGPWVKQVTTFFAFNLFFSMACKYFHVCHSIITVCLVAEPDKVLVGELNVWVANTLGPDQISALQIKTRSA